MNTRVNFTIDYLSYLDKADSIPATIANPELMLALYRSMVQLRTFDEKAVKLQRTGKLGTYASTLGQEAVSVGYGHAMQSDDVLAPYYRDYGAMIQRGTSMTEILRYWGGDERGSNYANNPEDFPICVPIATQNLHAIGVAKAMQYRKQARAVVTTIGEGGTSEGNFYEAVNCAGAWNLPVVFIVNNNQWAISVARDVQTGCQTIAQKAIAGGVDGLQVDGNDALAVYHASAQALEKARRGDGPTVIEAITYRLCDHTTADDATRYRSKEELDAAWDVEPIKRLREYLIANKHWDDASEKALLAECKTDIEKAVDAYLTTPKAPVTDMFDYLYAELPEGMIDQRDTAAFYGENYGK